MKKKILHASVYVDPSEIVTHLVGLKEVRVLSCARGLSASRLNQARSLYAPFFGWAKRRGMTTRNRMAEFQVPTSTYRSTERTPPEVQEVALLLATAADETPDIAPLLVLAAVTGVRRGELVAIRRSSVAWSKGQVTIDSAVTASGKVKATKTYRARRFHIDQATAAMLKRHFDRIKERRMQRARRWTRIHTSSVLRVAFLGRSEAPWVSWRLWVCPGKFGVGILELRLLSR